VRNSSGNNTVIPVDTTGAFHNYRVAAPAGFAAFDLFVDGNLRFSGDPYVLNASNPEFDTVEWGDLSPGGGNGAIDWDYIRLTNHAPTSVPEPGAAALFLGAACTGIIVLRRRRRA
jgi:hypothetical protein